MISSPNFSEGEVLRASAPATPAEVNALAGNVRRTLWILERVRAIMGRPVVIESLVRTQAENDDTPGASATSDHVRGLAADIRVPGVPAADVMAHLAPHVRALGIDQLILNGPTVVHIGAGHRQRGQLLVAAGAGTYRPYLAGAIAQGIPGAPATAPADATAVAPHARPGPATAAGILPLLAVAALLVALLLFS